MGVDHPTSRGHIQALVCITKAKGATLKRERPSPQIKGAHGTVGAYHPASYSHAKALLCTSQSHGAEPKRGSPSAGLNLLVKVHHPNPRCHTAAWESIPKLTWPHLSVVVHHPNSRGHTALREFFTPTQGATLKRGSTSRQLRQESTSPLVKGQHRRVQVHHANSMSHNKACEFITPTQGEPLKRDSPIGASPYPQL